MRLGKILGSFKGKKPFAHQTVRLMLFSLACSLAQMTARLEDLEKQIANKK